MITLALPRPEFPGPEFPAVTGENAVTRENAVTGKNERNDVDDFGGISRGGAVLVVTAVTIAHPWQALRELLALARRLGRRALNLAMAPIVLVAAALWGRRGDRRPTFEDYLHNVRDEVDHPRPTSTVTDTELPQAPPGDSRQG
ncbi:hypothetical protein BCD49_18500 [Pseudofrankia sp. EUN1h]|nr:hypothetical protein BCD49_18500 [Pseudofrankia sp. EUN1h]